MGKIILNAENYADYKDVDSCFGSKEEGMSYDINEVQCQSCKDSELCKKIFEAPEGTRILNAAEADVAEVFDTEENQSSNPVEKVEPEDTQVFNRDKVKEFLINMGKDHDIEFKMVHMKTRDKLFAGEEQRFTITDKTLRVITEASPGTFNITPKDCEEKHNGFVVDFENTEAMGKVMYVLNTSIYGNKEELVENVLDLEQETTPEIDFKSEETSEVKGEEESIKIPDEHLKAYDEISTQRQIIGGISVTVYSDDTFNLSTTARLKDVRIEDVMEKFGQLLEKYISRV